MADPQPLGKKLCTVPGYEACWVQFATRGYPRKLRREWDESKGGDDTLAMVLRYVEAWHLTDLDGQPVSPGDVRALDNVEDAVVIWLTRAFTEFWLRELTAPTPNS